MQGIKKVNNNIALCLDSQGRQVLAMGRGVGFGSFPRTISLSEIERTFYNVSESQVQLVQNIPDEILTLSAEVVEQAQRLLPYAISPNATLSLADHLQFACERFEKNIRVKMPLSYDVSLQYPLEMEIASDAIVKVRKNLKKYLPESEAVGIAMVLVNAKISDTKQDQISDQNDFDKMLDLVVTHIEKYFDIKIDRSTFFFARFATHVYYLYQRICQGKVIETESVNLYSGLSVSIPEYAKCIDEISDEIESEYEERLTEEEKLYLLLHVNRICTREAADENA